MWNQQNQGRQGSNVGNQGARQGYSQGKATESQVGNLEENRRVQGTPVATTPRSGNDRPQAAARAPLRVVPPVDVFENDDEFLLVAEMPGGTSDKLDLRFAEDTLTLRCEREVADKGVRLLSELRPALYTRSFVVPKGVDVERIQADLREGVLRVHLPKSESLKPRQIEVRAA